MGRSSTGPGPDAAALTRFRTQFAKSFGPEATEQKERKIISTGSMELDLALGCGGLPQGRIIESWGPESTAKSTMGMIMLAEQQRAEPHRMCAWIDAEQTFEPEWARAHGVDLNRLLVIYPDDAESVADQINQVMQSKLFSYVILDSVGALVPEVEFDRDAKEVTVGKVAKIVTRMVHIAAVRGRQNGSTLHIVNQVRANIGGYGADTTTGGGWALKHVSSMKFKHKKTGDTPLHSGSGEDKQVVGRTFAIHVEKNKIAPPGRVANVTLLNQPSDHGPVGLDRAAEAFRVGKRLGVIPMAGGGYYTLPDGERLQGEPATKAHLREHPDLLDKIREQALAQIADQVLTVAQEEGITEQEATA